MHLSENRSLVEARSALAKGEDQLSIRRAFDYLGSHPDDPTAARIAALGLSRLIYADAAESFYETARRRGHLSLDDQHSRALGLTRANAREKAVAAYREILEKSPDDPIALQRLAAVEWTRGRYDEAIRAAEVLATTPTGKVQGEALLAEVNHDAGRRAAAIPHFRRVFELDPDLSKLPNLRIVFWREYGEDLLREGESAEAVKVLTNGMRHDSSPELFDLLGQACLEEGDLEQTERWWRRSSETNPERVTPLVLLGRLKIQSKEFDEALRLLKHAYDLKPNLYEVLFPLGRVHRLLGHDQEADRYFDQAAEAQRTRVPSTSTGMGAVATPSR